MCVWNRPGLPRGVLFHTNSSKQIFYSFLTSFLEMNSVLSLFSLFSTASLIDSDSSDKKRQWSLSCNDLLFNKSYREWSTKTCPCHDLPWLMFSGTPETGVVFLLSCWFRFFFFLRGFFPPGSSENPTEASSKSPVLKSLSRTSTLVSWVIWKTSRTKETHLTLRIPFLKCWGWSNKRSFRLEDSSPSE